MGFIENLITGIGQVKDALVLKLNLLKSQIGTLPSLTTTNKNSLVEAINEVKSTTLSSASNYINKTINGVGSYWNFVIPLFEYTVSTSSLDNYFYGEIAFNRYNGNNRYRSIAKIYGGNTYNAMPTVSYEANTQGTDLVTFTYNGKTYVGIRWIGASDYTEISVSAFVSDTNLFSVIRYYNQNTQVVQNAEINDSVQPYIPLGSEASTHLKYFTEHNKGVEAIRLILERTNNTNTVVQLINQAKNFHFGTNDGDNFVIGTTADLNSTSNRWFWVNRDGTIYTPSHGNSSQWDTAYSWGNYRQFGLGVGAVSINWLGGTNMDWNTIPFGKTAFIYGSNNSLNYGGNVNEFPVGVHIGLNQNIGADIIVGRPQGTEGTKLRFRATNSTHSYPWLEVWHSGNFNPTDSIQVLSNGSGYGQVLLSGGGGSVALNSLVSYSRQDANENSGLSGLKVYTNTTNSLNYPSAFGGGIVINDTGGRYFEIWKSNSFDKVIRYRTRNSATEYGDWKIFADRDWINSQLGNYALLSQVYTQTQALGLFVGLTGVQTIAGTKTFSSSPIVPNATSNSHAVNLGQLNTLLANYLTSIPYATNAIIGGFKLFSNTQQTIAPNAVSATTGRTYAVQLDSNGQAMVNVPWTNTNTTYSAGNGITQTGNTFSMVVNESGSAGSGMYVYSVTQEAGGIKVTYAALPNTTYTLPTATSTIKGGVELFSDTVQSVAANAVTATTGRTYGIQLNSAGQMVVNVPWTDINTTYAQMTATVFGLGKLFSSTVQSVSANSVSAVTSRTYGVQVNSSGQLVVNVPWENINTTTQIGVNGGNYSSGNINFVGSNGVSVSKSGNTVTFTGNGGSSSASPSASTNIIGNGGISFVPSKYKTLIYGGNYSTESNIVIEDTDGYATDEGAEIIISTNYNHGVVVMFQSHDVIINSGGGINTIGAGNPIKIRNEHRAVFVWSNDYGAYLFMSQLNNYDI